MTLIALQGKYTVDSINNVSACTLMQITLSKYKHMRRQRQIVESNNSSLISFEVIVDFA